MPTSVTNVSYWDIFVLCDTDRTYINSTIENIQNLTRGKKLEKFVWDKRLPEQEQYGDYIKEMANKLFNLGYTFVEPGRYKLIETKEESTVYVTIIVIYKEDLHLICKTYPIEQNRGIVISAEGLHIQALGNLIRTDRDEDEKEKNRNNLLPQPESRQTRVRPSTNRFQGYFGIKGNNGRFVNGKRGDGYTICSSPYIKAMEIFSLENAGGGKVALKSCGKYLCSENGEEPMTCDREVVLGWEQFTWIDHPDGTFSLKGNNGKYVSSENGENPMMCNREIITKWEKFFRHDL